VLEPSPVVVNRSDPADFEVRINFGMLAGREATPAELDDLASRLVPLLGSVALVSEHRQETDGTAEIELHQVRIDLTEDDPVADVVAIAELWAEACFEARHAEISEP
jgi:hypothetical protein